MKVFVINVSSKYEQRAVPTLKLLSKLPTNDFDVRIHKATTPADFSVSDLHPVTQHSITTKSNCNHYSPPTHINQVACAKSHIALWKTCVNLNEPIIIAEDDLFTYPKVIDNIMDNVQNIPDEADVVLFLRSFVDLKKKTTSYDINPMFKRVLTFAGAQCYYITPRAASTLLVMVEPIVCHVDMYMDLFTDKLTILTVNNSLISMMNGQSMLSHKAPQLVVAQVLSVFFGIVSLVLVVVLVIMFMKHKKLHPKPL